MLFATRCSIKRGCLPHKLRTFVKERIDGGASQLSPEKWQLLLDWCVTSAQEQNGTSLLNIGSTDPALCQDHEFLDWCDQRIEITLGAAPRATMGQAQGGGGRDLHLVQQITSNMG